MSRRHRRAFTLVEVILAILIISGIMTVLLYFYQRAAETRQNALEEAQFLSEARMFLDQITGELRTARVVPDQFVGLEGASNSLTFVCTTIPQMARWIINTNEPGTLPPATDLKKVHYGLVGGTNLAVIRGLDRSEELLLTTGYSASTNATEFIDPAATNLTAEADVLLTDQTPVSRPPLTERIKHLSFRFWSGREWLETWSGMDLPNGVEITLGREPMPADAGEVYPYDIMRRVIYLPGSTPPANQVILDLESSMEEFPL